MKKIILFLIYFFSFSELKSNENLLLKDKNISIFMILKFLKEIKHLVKD